MVGVGELAEMLEALYASFDAPTIKAFYDANKHIFEHVNDFLNKGHWNPSPQEQAQDEVLAGLMAQAKESQQSQSPWRVAFYGAANGWGKERLIDEGKKIGLIIKQDCFDIVSLHPDVVEVGGRGESLPGVAYDAVLLPCVASNPDEAKNILSTTLSSVRVNGFVVVSDILNRTVGLAEVQRLASKLDFVEVAVKTVVVNGSFVELVTILVKDAKSSDEIASLLSDEGMTRRVKQVKLDLGDSNRLGLSRLSELSLTSATNSIVTVSHDHKTTKANTFMVYAVTVADPNSGNVSVYVGSSNNRSRPLCHLNGEGSKSIEDLVHHMTPQQVSAASTASALVQLPDLPPVLLEALLGSQSTWTLLKLDFIVRLLEGSCLDLLLRVEGAVEGVVFCNRTLNTFSHRSSSIITHTREEHLELNEADSRHVIGPFGGNGNQFINKDANNTLHLQRGEGPDMRRNEEERRKHYDETGEYGGGTLSRKEHQDRKAVDSGHVIGSFGGNGNQFSDKGANSKRRRELGQGIDGRNSKHFKHASEGDGGIEAALLREVVVVRLPPPHVFPDGTSDKEFSYAAEAQRACEEIGVVIGYCGTFAGVLKNGYKSLKGVQIRYKDDLPSRPFENEPPPSKAVGVWKWKAKSGGPFGEKRTIVLVEYFTSKSSAVLSVNGKVNGSTRKSLSKAIVDKTAWMGFLWTDSDKSP